MADSIRAFSFKQYDDIDTWSIESRFLISFSMCFVKTSFKAAKKILIK